MNVNFRRYPWPDDPRDEPDQPTEPEDVRAQWEHDRRAEEIDNRTHYL